MKNLILAISFLVSISAFAQTKVIKTAEVRVLCENDKGTPLANQKILFENQQTKVQVGGKTDSTGRFVIDLPKNSKYLIKNQTLTYEASNSIIEIPDEKDSLLVDLTLTIYPPVNNVYTLENVYFDFAKATIRAESNTSLNKLASALIDSPSTFVEIAGHTDNVGDDASNLILSQKRAESVRNYLIAKKVPADRVAAKGYGANEPIADNHAEEGRNKNRRTEVRILKN